jgi:hypothetical protein
MTDKQTRWGVVGLNNIGLVQVFDDRPSADAFALQRGKGHRVVIGHSEGTKDFHWSESENAKGSFRPAPMR